MSVQPGTRREIGFLLLGIVVLSAAVTTSVFLSDGSPSPIDPPKPIRSDVGGVATSLFPAVYPVSDRFRSELNLLRKKGRLTDDNAQLISHTVSETSAYLKIPPALLWCLFFQESRLNHLEGIDADRGARGLGQFSHFSFYEVNHHLTRYTDANLFVMKELLGRDIRPVEPRQSDLKHPSSYFYIPTAVVASAMFLNNRHHQIRRMLERRKLAYDPDILWLLSAMAYNKGGRSVVSLLNTTRRRRGTRELSRLLTDKDIFFSTVTDVPQLAISLRRIWPTTVAGEYARELGIHMKNLRDCSVGEPTAREVATQGEEARPQ